MSIDIDVGQNKKYASKQQYGGSEYTSGENIKALIMLCVHTYYEGVFDDFISFFDFFFPCDTLLRAKNYEISEDTLITDILHIRIWHIH